MSFGYAIGISSDPVYDYTSITLYFYSVHYLYRDSKCNRSTTNKHFLISITISLNLITNSVFHLEYIQKAGWSRSDLNVSRV